MRQERCPSCWEDADRTQNSWLTISEKFRGVNISVRGNDTALGTKVIGLRREFLHQELSWVWIYLLLVYFILFLCMFTCLCSFSLPLFICFFYIFIPSFFLSLSLPSYFHDFPLYFLILSFLLPFSFSFLPSPTKNREFELHTRHGFFCELGRSPTQWVLPNIF